jgi:hypothetical protein
MQTIYIYGTTTTEDNTMNNNKKKTFRMHCGTRVRLADDLQSLTAPAFKILKFHKGIGWRVWGDAAVSYATLADAVASHDWLSVDERCANPNLLPYAVLELHPEGVTGYRLWHAGDSIDIDQWDGFWGSNHAWGAGLLVLAD